MPERFNSPAAAKKQEVIPYPNSALTIREALDDEALRCMIYAARVTKTPLKTLLSQVALDWYDTEGQILMNLVEAAEAKGKRKGRKRSRVAVIPLAKAS